MAEYKAESGEQHEVEVKERGLFDHFSKKDDEEKSHEEVLVTGVENVHIEEVEKKEGLLHKLHRSTSSSSSSSDEEEEVEVDGVLVKQKKKKGLKEKIKEKLGHKKEEEEVKEDVEVKHEVAAATVITDNYYGDSEVKVEKVDEKIEVGETHEEEKKEKKGILGKIMEKLPGYHKGEKDEKASPASH